VVVVVSAGISLHGRVMGLAAGGVGKGYGLIYETIFDSSVARDWEALVTFICLIAMADAEDNVYTSPDRLHRKTGIPLKVIRKGLEVLLSEDPYSFNKAENGRRIKFLPLVGTDEVPSLDGHCRGFFIVNRAYYKRLLRKKYNASYMRARRARDRDGNPSQDELSGRSRSEEASEALEDFRK